MRRIGELIAERYGNQTARRIGAGVTSTDSHEYRIEINTSSSNLTVAELHRVVPDEIEARFQYPHSTVTVAMPVQVTEQDTVIGQSGSALDEESAPSEEHSLLSSLLEIVSGLIDWLTFW